MIISYMYIMHFYHICPPLLYFVPLPFPQPPCPFQLFIIQTLTH